VLLLILSALFVVRFDDAVLGADVGTKLVAFKLNAYFDYAV